MQENAVTCCSTVHQMAAKRLSGCLLRTQSWLKASGVCVYWCVCYTHAPVRCYPHACACVLLHVCQCASTAATIVQLEGDTPKHALVTSVEQEQAEFPVAQVPLHNTPGISLADAQPCPCFPLPPCRHSFPTCDSRAEEASGAAPRPPGADSSRRVG